MKSQKGITLTSLVIYIVVATIVISTMAVVSSFFFSNMDLIKNKDQYAIEFNKFNMFFVNDIKSNKIVEINGNKLTFPDGTIYEYNSEQKVIYRNNTQIAKQIQEVTFTAGTHKVSNTTKNLITVNLSIGKEKKFQKEIEYVLKYW